MRRLAIMLLSAFVALTGCTPVLFQPMERMVLTPDRLSLRYDDVFFESTDGVRLHGWYLHAGPGARGTVLFLHGNAQNISTHIASVFWLPRRGFNVFLFDYRGFGRSEGVAATIADVHRDTAGALRALRRRDDVDPDRLVLFGQSLGASVAISFASERPGVFNAVIAESAFDGYRHIAREKLAASWLTWAFQWPLSFLMSDAYRPLDAVARLAPTPLLLVYDTGDTIVPPHHGVSLYRAAREPKAFWCIPGRGHIQAVLEPWVRERLLDYLDAVLAAKGESPPPVTRGLVNAPDCGFNTAVTP
ncbi:MAG: alpha/beta hydrolase [Gammaproteobacteria bacterium]|nr:alpha/beta hydrolase [Gammaproteobacteria bacterium]